VTPAGSSDRGVRWTTRAYLLLGAGCVLAAAAVALRSPDPLFVALPLLVAPFAAASIVPEAPPTADLSWGAGGIGENVEVEGTLRGKLGRGAGNLSVRLRPPPGAVQTAPLRVAPGAEATRFTVGWRLRDPTIASVAAPEVLWTDPLGLCERPLGGERPALSLGRYPSELRHLGSVRLDRTIPLPGETRSRRLGRSGEFHGIREAEPNEPWNRVNWRASARMGRLLANELEVELTGDLVILLDVRPVSPSPTLNERLLGIARAGVYGIADALLRTKVRLGYASFGEFLEAVPLSTGRGHRLRLLRAVAESRLSDVAGPAERCVYALRRYFRPGVTTLVFSGWQGLPSEGLTPYLRRFGYPPLLVSPSPLPLLQRPVAGSEEPLAQRLQRLQRRVRLSEFWQYGPVVDWDDYWSLGGLARFLRRPTRRRVS
jgi:uncharacterized protein (DUF58 family)